MSRWSNHELGLYYDPEDVPGHLPKYSGKLFYIEGTWGNARQATWEIPEGGFAVEGPKGFIKWKKKYHKWGTFSIFKADGSCDNIIPWGLIIGTEIEEIPKDQSKD